MPEFNLESGLATVVAAAKEHAQQTDQTAAFPEKVLAALRTSGFLGLTSSTEVGGQGATPVVASLVVRQLAAVCGSSAMVLTMHYAATAAIEALGLMETRRAIAQGEHLSTLAFSEVGSRSQFWAPTSTATRQGSDVALTAHKTFVTSAHFAASFVWSSAPCDATGPSTLWLVPRATKNLSTAPSFDGLGLRGNDSCAVRAENALVPTSAMMGADGKGMDAMLGIVLPWFNTLSASCSVGLARGAYEEAIGHVARTRHAHTATSLADLPTIRAYVARMQLCLEQAELLVQAATEAVTQQRPDATLRVLQSKAGASEAALTVTELAMRVCGGAAFRKELNIERAFRDARAASVMGPTTDVLYDFLGRLACGLPLFGGES